MSEAIYEEVERVIQQRLHIGAPGTTPLGGPRWAYPDSIELGNIVMRDSDCGLAKPTFIWTTDQWEENQKQCGLWRKVGMWSFVRAEDPAADEIALCHCSPEWAGQELARLRARVEELEAHMRGVAHVSRSRPRDDLSAKAKRRHLVNTLLAVEAKALRALEPE